MLSGYCFPAMQFTVEIPDELGDRLKALQAQLPKILELGLRELAVSAQSGFSGVAEVLEFLAQLPTPEEILALRPSTALQTQIDQLLETNRTVGLNADEAQVWEQYQFLEHLVRVAKIKALLKLNVND